MVVDMGYKGYNRVSEISDKLFSREEK